MALSDCMQKSSFSKRINNAYRNCLWNWVAKVAYLSLLISLGATHRAGPNDFKMQPDVGRSEKLMNLTWVKKWWFLPSFPKSLKENISWN